MSYIIFCALFRFEEDKKISLISSFIKNNEVDFISHCIGLLHCWINVSSNGYRR